MKDKPIRRFRLWNINVKERYGKFVRRRTSHRDNKYVYKYRINRGYKTGKDTIDKGSANDEAK